MHTDTYCCNGVWIWLLKAVLFPAVATIIALSSFVHAQHLSLVAQSDSRAIQLARRMRDNRERLFRTPGGFQFNFRVDAEQRKASPYFLYPDGIDGVFRMKWPKIRNEVHGIMHGIIELDGAGRPNKVARMRDVIASYDFDTKTSVTIDDGATATIEGKRLNETSRSVYPFSLQDMAEFSVLYFHGDELKTDYWLPHALEQYSYELVGEELVDDILCQILERRGVDKLWIATDHGCVVLRRELRWGDGKSIREALSAHNLMEVSPGTWMPLQIVHDDFDKDNADKRLVRYTVGISGVEVGNVTDDMLIANIPEGIKIVKDYATGTVSFLGTEKSDEEERLLRAVELSRERAIPPPQRRSYLIALLLLQVVLGLGIALVVLHRRRR